MGPLMPLTQALYDELRQSILGGQLLPGTRLPSTRALAEERGVSRNTVLNAYEQLLAEGYVEARVGSGTCVARALPEGLLTVSGSAASCSRAIPGVRSACRANRAHSSRDFPTPRRFRSARGRG